MKFITLALLICALSIAQIKSQVTIGSNQKPASGSILELKEDNGTKRGLILPRVKLTNKKPITDIELAHSIGNTTGAYERNKHTGLVVYNINDDPKGCRLNDEVYHDVPSKGIYVWDGEEWQRFPEPEDFDDIRSITYHDTNIIDGIIVGSFTMTVSDGTQLLEKEQYYYADYAEAGIWMTQNLRTHYTPTGLHIPSRTDATTSGFNSSGNRLYGLSYPNSSSLGDSTDPTLYNEHKEYGILYNWHTASNYENCSHKNQEQQGFLNDPLISFGENEVESKAKEGYIKGICPKGWHLPSDREWNQLEKYMTENAATVTKDPVTPNNVWNESYENTIQWRGVNHGATMVSTTMVANSSFLLYKANSKRAQGGGFDVLLIGHSTVDNKSFSYGYNGFFWTSSTKDNNYSWIRAFNHDSYEACRVAESKYAMFSVRCKKND